MGWFFDPVQPENLDRAISAVQSGKASAQQTEAVERAASQAGGGPFSAARAALEEKDKRR
ncbi:hypothetical protein HG426_003835 [Candidatus Saccharibacteria bacterium]|jgi:hypothetical protein|nr:hypothetical protein [Candidatus Saccharibacteria bacterium]